MSLSSRIKLVLKNPRLYLGFFALGALVITFRDVEANIKAESRLIAPPPGIEYFTFGYKEPFADSLWIRAIQDFDYCDEQIKTNFCRNNSWLSQMLDLVTTLSPHFRMPYATGPVALSVLISDIDGATQLFEKGIRQFPNDWPILYRAAYHYIYEVGNKGRAAELMERAAKNGGEPWMYSLASRLYGESGQLELGIRLYEEMKHSNIHPNILARMRSKIEQFQKNKNQ
jgi:pentatricopeptide repeat protein